MSCSRRPWTNPERLDLPIVRWWASVALYVEHVVFFDSPSKGSPRMALMRGYSGYMGAVRSQVVALYRAGAVWLTPSSRHTQGHIRFTEEALAHPDLTELLWKRGKGGTPLENVQVTIHDANGQRMPIRQVKTKDLTF